MDRGFVRGDDFSFGRMGDGVEVVVSGVVVIEVLGALEDGVLSNDSVGPRVLFLLR